MTTAMRRTIPVIHRWADLVAAAVALLIAGLDFAGQALPGRYAFACAAVAALGRAWYERAAVAPVLDVSGGAAAAPVSVADTPTPPMPEDDAP